MQAAQHWKELWGILDLLTERVGPGVRLLHLWGRIALGGRQCRAQGDLQGQFVLGARRGCWQGGEQIEPDTEILYCFRIGRARMSALAGAVLIGHGLLSQTRLRIVMG